MRPGIAGILQMMDWKKQGNMRKSEPGVVVPEHDQNGLRQQSQVGVVRGQVSWQISGKRMEGAEVP